MNLDYEYLASLVERAQQKDSDAFAELYLATYKKVYRFACHYLQDSDEAKDAMQETYIIVFKKLNSLKDPHLFISWLNQIVFRVCFGMTKKNEHQADWNELTPDMAAPAEESPEARVVRLDESSYIVNQVMGLPFSEAQVILLHYYNNMKIEDIARLLEISRSTVKRYLESGRRKLSQVLRT